jgi:hypothetical protein
VRIDDRPERHRHGATTQAGEERAARHRRRRKLLLAHSNLLVSILDESDQPVVRVETPVNPTD